MGSFRCHVSVANITHLSFWEYRLSVSRQTLWVVEWGLAIPAIPYCRGKNSRSKKIGQTTQKMIHFVPNMTVCFLENLSTCSRTQNVKNFGILGKKRKVPKTTRFQDLQVFAFFFVFFSGVLRVVSLVVWGAANMCRPLSHQAQKHAIKVLESMTKVVSRCFG